MPLPPIPLRFSEIYADKSFHYSIEVYPPKTEKGVENLLKELEELKAISPAYVSVTYGAMGTTRALTKDLAIRIHDQLKINTAFHFTCIGSGRKEIKKYVNSLRERGIELIVALRGDYPRDNPSYRPPADGFRYANELVDYLKSINDFSIAVAGYPETHVEAPSPEADLENLKRKVDAGADVIITQLFFDNRDFYNWVKKVRKLGITVPIIAGIMPILKLSQIQKITGLCGARIPKDLVKKLKACGEDEDAMRDVGVRYAIEQCRDLIKNNVAGIHFYCLNKAYSVLRVVKACQDLVPVGS